MAYYKLAVFLTAYNKLAVFDVSVALNDDFITKVIYTPQVVGIAYPVGWLMASVLLGIWYYRALKQTEKQMQEVPA